MMSGLALVPYTPAGANSFAFPPAKTIPPLPGNPTIVLLAIEPVVTLAIVETLPIGFTLMALPWDVVVPLTVPLEAVALVNALFAIVRLEIVPSYCVMLIP